MRTLKVVLVQTALLGLSLPAFAQPVSRTTTTGTVVAMPRAANPATQPPVAVPPRGMTMARVIQRYGAPLQKHAPIGQPPITRWDYAGYHLYFEYNHVLHAVVPGNPVPLVHEAELTGNPPE